MSDENGRQCNGTSLESLRLTTESRIDDVHGETGRLFVYGVETLLTR